MLMICYNDNIGNKKIKRTKMTEYKPGYQSNNSESIDSERIQELGSSLGLSSETASRVVGVCGDKPVAVFGSLNKTQELAREFSELPVGSDKVVDMVGSLRESVGEEDLARLIGDALDGYVADEGLAKYTELDGSSKKAIRELMVITMLEKSLRWDTAESGDNATAYQSIIKYSSPANQYTASEHSDGSIITVKKIAVGPNIVEVTINHDSNNEEIGFSANIVNQSGGFS